MAFLDSGPDGESLVINNTEWRDPFLEIYAPGNDEFVAKSGKRTAFDVSNEPEYRKIIGSKIYRVELVMTSTGKIVGAVFKGGKNALFRVDVESDELHVSTLD